MPRPAGMSIGSTGRQKCAPFAYVNLSHKWLGLQKLVTIVSVQTVSKSG
jgi:hypothetical protein